MMSGSANYNESKRFLRANKSIRSQIYFPPQAEDITLLIRAARRPYSSA